MMECTRLSHCPTIFLDYSRLLAMLAFPCERDLINLASVDLDTAISGTPKRLPASQGVEGKMLRSSLDHHSYPECCVEFKHRLIELGDDQHLLRHNLQAVDLVLCTISDRRYPHFRHDFHVDQRSQVVEIVDHLYASRENKLSLSMTEFRGQRVPSLCGQNCSSTAPLAWLPGHKNYSLAAYV